MKTTETASRKPLAGKVTTITGAKANSSGIDKIKDVQKLVHMLEVYQVELEHQNQELRITEEELEISRNKYVNLFDFSPIPYFALDLDGKITEVNVIAGKMFGVDRSKLIGRRFVGQIPPDEKTAFNEFFKTVINSSAKQSCALRVRNKDKNIFHVRLEGMRFDDTLESTQRCQIALIDRTEYKKLEDSLTAVSNELASLKNTLRAQS
jgi:PAS domain S-box-containing protein